MLEKCCATVGHPPVEVIGDFVLPPADGHESRDFQTLHFDFGLPLDPRVAQDVARYTALYIPGDRRKVGAVTRLVPLAALLHQRSWPSEHELLQRLAVYGTTHGAWRDEGRIHRRQPCADRRGGSRHPRPSCRASKPIPSSFAAWSSTTCRPSFGSSYDTACRSRRSRSTLRCARVTCWSSITSLWPTVVADLDNQASFINASSVTAASLSPASVACAITSCQRSRRLRPVGRIRSRPCRFRRRRRSGRGRRRRQSARPGRAERTGTRREERV